MTDDPEHLPHDALIAAASPAAILALIAMLRKAEGERAEAQASEAELVQACADLDLRIEDAEAARKAAEERAGRMAGALEPFIKHYEPWMDEYPDDSLSSTYSRHTFGELRRAREALAALDPAQSEGTGS